MGIVRGRSEFNHCSVCIVLLWSGMANQSDWIRTGALGEAVLGQFDRLDSVNPERPPRRSVQVIRDQVPVVSASNEADRFHPTFATCFSLINI